MIKQELEVKILEIDAKSVISRLEDLGAVKAFDGTILADFYKNPDSLKLRLRRMGGRNVLTFKVIRTNIEVIQNDEIEISFDSYEGMTQVLMAIGFSKYGHSEKSRISYNYKNIHFEIDSMPGIPTFLEIEATCIEDVKTGVELLGYDMSQTSIMTERTIKEHYGVG